MGGTWAPVSGEGLREIEGELNPAGLTLLE